MTPENRTWVLRGATLIAIFIAAISMEMQRFAGWPLLIACFAVGTLGGLAFILSKRRLAAIWNGMPNRSRVAFVISSIAVFLVAILVLNRGRPDASLNIFGAVFGVVLALILWGLYWLVSRAFDHIWARFARR